MKLSQFTLFKNTNFTDMQNTLHFNSNTERDNWFTNYFTGSNVIEFENSFNFRYDRGVLKVPMVMNDLQGFNYCKFIDGFDGKTYYAFIVKTSYLNPRTTQLDLVIDAVMTYTQGNILETLSNVEVIRQHLPMQELINREEFLRTNNDTLPTSTMKFVDPRSWVRQEEGVTPDDYVAGVDFNEVVYIIQSAVDLTAEFGTEDKPKMSTATGGTYDGITSAVNLYLVEPDKLDKLLAKLSNYPWITQNFKTIVKVPKRFVKLDELLPVEVQGITLYMMTAGVMSKDIFLPFNITKTRIKKALNLKPHENYLIRDNVINFYLTDYRGNQLNFETGQITDTNDIVATCVLGAYNEIDVYSLQYGQRSLDKTRHGYYRDNQMSITTFDNVPVMINNYTLNKANSAYSRQLENSKTLSGRIQAVTNPNNSVKDRLFNAVSVYSNVFAGGIASAPAKAAGLFSDEYEYYRNQKAQMNQWKISPPTISEGSYSNAPLSKTGDWGIWLKVSTINDKELQSLRRYYGNFGHEALSNDNQIFNVNSMSKANWVQFKGNYWIEDIDRELFDQLKTLFEGGVRLWHSYADLSTRTDMAENNVIR
jgi:hypothetical protein